MKLAIPLDVPLMESATVMEYAGVEADHHPMNSRIPLSIVCALGLVPVIAATSPVPAEEPAVPATDCNALILENIAAMPSGGRYAAYRRDLPEDRRFDDLYATVDALSAALEAGERGRLKVKPKRARPQSFCSSATYLLFCEVVADLQKKGAAPADPRLSQALADVGDTREVIHGKLDGVGLFGHWNADGPGTAVLFHRLGLGRNFSRYEDARPGDFLKIFWNEHIGKGERGHLVVYLGENESGDAIRVWSSNLENEDGSSGYGTMWVEKSRIRRAVFSRLEHPERLVRWLSFAPAEHTSDYLVRIRETGSTGEEMKRAAGIEE